MAKIESNIHIYGDLENGVYVAPKGTTPPTDLADVAAPFKEVGWISEDGVTESADLQSETYRAWQGATIVRKSITSNDRTFTFFALEENAITQGLKYRGQESESVGGVRRTTVEGQTRNDERAWTVDFFDGGHRKRYAIPIGFYEVTGEQTYAATGITMLEITVTPIGAYEEISTDPETDPSEPGA